MSFAVFPHPQSTPLTISPGTTKFTPFTQLTGGSVPPGTYFKMMFMRVAMSGAANPPTLFLKAGSGNAVEITESTVAVFRGPNPVDDYVGDVQLFREPHNVYQIRMGFNRDSTEQWQLGVKNNSASWTDFTWVVAESEAETAQPWIDALPNGLDFTALVGESLSQTVWISNKGTGALNLTSTSLAPLGSFTVSSALPLTIQPSGAEPLTITLKAPGVPPGFDGRIFTSAKLTASPPDTTATSTVGHNQEVGLFALVQRLEVVLLLDASGSMAWDAQGELPPAGSPRSRWAELSSATGQFLDLLAHFGKGRGRFGVARFPAREPNNPATSDIVPMTEIPDVAGMAAAKAAVAAVKPVPDTGTPMGDGLNRMLTFPTTFFGVDNVSLRSSRRWLILMSDGANNSGTNSPLKFISPPAGTATPGSSMAEKSISLFAVGYGIPGFTDVDHVLLKQLSAGSLGGGQQRFVDQEGTTATQLAGALRDVLKSGLTPTASPRDPEELALQGFGEARHEVLLTEFDRRAALVLNWNNPDPGRLRLELLTPLQERITPDNAGQDAFSGITFRGDDRSQLYLIDPGFLNGTAEDDPGGASTTRRHGTWTLLVTAPADVPGGSPELPGEQFVAERYTYDTLVDSNLHLSLEMDRTDYFAGDPVTVAARLTVAGKPVTGASVSLTATVPTQSLANWLAGLRIPDQFMAQAVDEMTGLDATPLLVKKHAARLAGFDFDDTRRHVTSQMTDPDGSGIYRATLTNTSVPEHYAFYVTAMGTADGVSFRREAKQDVYVLVRPEPDASRIDIQQHERGTAEATLIPRDRFGNVLLVDPQVVGSFDLAVTGTELGPITAHLDGTYTATVRFDPGTAPAVGFSYGGTQVISPKAIPPLDDLHYPDRMVAFEPGGLNLANTHASPEAALGSVAGKAPDQFVALGGGGRLALGFERRVILGGSDSDITVFIRPDDDQRAYRVEAYSEERQDWVALGESSGVTESFQLRSAGLESTPAVRVTDTSGRTRDADLNPLATPGVSVRGIGVRQTSRRLP
ncbi:hypothetical protein ABZ547_33535 [Streptomyces sparsogenes]|uniref:hypothetical protein n=1 Tax=Streptomyces sparsogenes TaxID=67365 RepID=UPI00340335E1